MDTDHPETGQPIHLKMVNRFTTLPISNLAIAIKKPFNASTNTTNTTTTSITTSKHQD
jgi:hypothetical protein